VVTRIAATVPVGDGWDWSQVRERCMAEAERLVRDREQAEEVVQEALTRAWRSRASCRDPRARVGWALSITRNEAFRLHERRERLGGREIATAEPPEPGAENGLEQLLSQLSLRETLATLAPEDRRLVELRYVHDLSQPQVARSLDLPEGTVKVRLHRLRGRLRKILEESELEAAR